MKFELSINPHMDSDYFEELCEKISYDVEVDEEIEKVCNYLDSIDNPFIVWEQFDTHRFDIDIVYSDDKALEIMEEMYNIIVSILNDNDVAYATWEEYEEA